MALARALLSQPRWLLLDEPLTGLDGRRRQQLARLLESIQQRFAIPTVLVTHQLDAVARLVDDVVVLRAGRIEQAGPAASLLPRLDPSLHAGGAVLEGVWARNDARLLAATVTLEGCELLVPLAAPGSGTDAVAPGAVVPGTAVRVYLRPEDVAIAHRPIEGLSIRNQLPCTIERLVDLPGSPFVELMLALGEQSFRSRITRAASEALGLRAGQEVVALIKALTLEPPLWHESRLN